MNRRRSSARRPAMERQFAALSSGTELAYKILRRIQREAQELISRVAWRTR